MRIGVEASRANRAQRTGVEWYACRLLQVLASLPAAADHDWTAYVETPMRADLRSWLPGWHERVLRWPPKYLWTQVRLSWEMRQAPPDVLFVPAHVLPRVLPKKTVVTVHDVGFRRFPGLYKPIQVAYHELTTRDIVASEAKIVTVSEFSKRELIELYGARPDRITVTPLGIDQDRYLPPTEPEKLRIRREYGLERPFFVFIGRLEEKKNILRLVQAFCMAAEASGSDHELVLAGPAGKGWAEAEVWLRGRPSRARVRVLGYLPESDKPGLIGAAEGYVQASMYEGFGLPILEAMACGTPVLLSTAEALLEVLGDGPAIRFDPASTEAVVDAFQRGMSLSSSDRAAMIAAGSARVRPFTWRRTAEQTLPVLVS